VKAVIHTQSDIIEVDLSKPLDISIPLRKGPENPTAWYVDPLTIEPVRGEGFVGKVSEGGSVNFNNIAFNPHGHGTHTECVGHITPEDHFINDHLKQFMFTAKVISVRPEKLYENNDFGVKGDGVITPAQIAEAIGNDRPEAIVLRTLPNEDEKLSHQYSNTNWPYLHPESAKLISDLGIDHILIDLPSVDREEDGGKLLAHKAFWNYPENTQFQRTITELIYVPDSIIDGNYLLNIQIASFENDASPSKPVLYKILN